MKENVLKVLIPVIALLVIVESVVLITKYNKSSSITGPVALKQASNQPVTIGWDMGMTEVKVGVMSEVPLYITSDKDVSIDAIDLYIKYDPASIMVKDAIAGPKFVSPSFKKVSPDNGLVVMNYLVSEASGFKLAKGEKVEIARIQVNFTKEGSTELSLGDATLVVENASAKVLPFNSDSLVINISR